MNTEGINPYKGIQATLIVSYRYHKQQLKIPRFSHLMETIRGFRKHSIFLYFTVSIYVFSPPLFLFHSARFASYVIMIWDCDVVFTSQTSWCSCQYTAFIACIITYSDRTLQCLTIIKFPFTTGCCDAIGESLSCKQSLEFDSGQGESF